MTGLQSLIPLLAVWVAVPLVLFTLFVLWIAIKYTPVISRHFEQQPPFMPSRLRPADLGEPVEFATDDGLRLCGSYLPGRAREQAGVIVYCHEYLSDRWSYHPYLDHLRDLGFDVFAFDFRNHGESDSEPAYEPMQWTSDREVRDLRGALEKLRSRPDRDPAGFGLFGVSRGGTTALLAGSSEPDVWGVVTDGAFPYPRNDGPVHRSLVRDLRPQPYRPWSIADLGLANSGIPARRQAERRLSCRFPSVEAAAAKLAPRPWLMIHGERDSYISADIARELFRRGKKYKELWLVKDAKNNRCRETDPDGYESRLMSFLERFAPRRPSLAEPAAALLEELPVGLAADAISAAELTSEVASPIS